MSESVVKRRLKSLHQQRAEKAAAAAAAKQRKAERDEQLVKDTATAAERGISVYMLEAGRRGPLVLPMAAHYARSAEHEVKRAKFYADIALVYGSSGWHFSNPGVRTKAGKAGYEGRDREIQALDQESSVNLNVASAPLEWLAAKGRLETHADPSGQRMVRFAVASKFRDVSQGADFAGLKGQAYDGGSGGGGGGGRPVTDHMIDCVKIVTEVRASMHPGMFRMLVRVVCLDEWVWEKARKAKDRRAIIEHLHKALDKAAVTLRYMTAADYKKRWGSFTLRWTPLRRKKKAAKPGGPPSAA